MGLFSGLKGLPGLPGLVRGATTGGPFGGGSPIGVAQLMAAKLKPRLPGGQAKAMPTTATGLATQSTQTATPDHGFPAFTPAPQADWKTAGPYGEDTSYGTDMNMPLGQRLNSGGWNGSDY